ncbi:restriction endonuclease subunit S [Odoribacter lunatus]|uniref:restriction endonuclease subunit S n=1 Tax=Odoribacter lunatus TaxID=2941335 RepID=UPI00203F6475|nr:restriction endonuclease subunit S [Odoribacter lunatus]
MGDGNVKWVRLEDYIVECDSRRNADNALDLSALRGVSINKTFIESKANMDGVSLSSYKQVRPNEFCYVTITSRNGDKISLALNDSDDTYIVSSSYVVFRILDTAILLPDYLYLIFSRPEFDRYARYNSWGSAREAFSFASMELVEIPLPSLDEQQKVVNAWKALSEIKEQNVAKVAPLMQLCQSYIQKLKHNCSLQEIGQYIEECDERNIGNALGADSVRGLATSKGMIDTKANLEGVSLTPYKIVKPDEIAYVPDTSRRGDKMSLGLNNTNENVLVSSISCVFKVKDKERLLPDFLYLWFCRPEFDRFVRFNSWGSARETFSFEDMKRVRIPIPDIDVQRAIVNIYKCTNEAKQIAEEADRLSREVCPALLQHIIHSTSNHN